jgi:hypothetical protein
MNDSDALTLHMRSQLKLEQARTAQRFQTSGIYSIGMDCGQAHDFSAVAILQEDGNIYRVIHLERLELDMPYPQQIDYLYNMMHRKPLSESRKSLAIDYTGVGRPVVDLAKERGLRPIGITIQGGNTVTWDKEKTQASVPKRDLINLMQIFAQNNRLKVAQNLKFGSILAQELQIFRVKIDLKTAHDSYGAWREGEHDDLVLATAIGLWCAVHRDDDARAPGIFIHRGGSSWR